MSGRLEVFIRIRQREVAKENEQKVRLLLEHWVSGLDPALAIDADGKIIGLTDADAPLDSSPYILRLEDCR